MVAQFLRLRLALLGNFHRRRPPILVGMIIGTLYALVLAVLVIIGLVALRSMSPDIARTIVIVAGALLFLGFALIPLAFGADDPLDPRRFVLFGIPTTRLCVNLAVAALVSVPAAFLIAVAIAQIATWSADGLSLALAVVVAPVIVATGILLSRLAAGIASVALSTRRRREAAGLGLLVVLAALAPAVGILATLDWDSHSLPILRRIAAVVTWTPLGAAWSVPGDAAIGRTDEIAAKLAIALGFLVVVAVAWRALVGWMLRTPQRAEERRRQSRLGWFDRLPDSAFGAVAARSLSYWSRDARYVLSVAVVPVIPIVMVLALAIGGVPWSVIAWVPVPVMCLFLGWTVHNDVAHDSTAFWMHLSTSISGVADRWGRVIPPLFIGVPLAVAGSVVTVLLTGDGDTLPALLGLSLCVLFVALGVSSVTSAAFPYATVRPGDSPFAQPQAAGGSGSVAQSFSFFLTVLAAVPVVWLIVMAGQDPALYWTAGAVGLGTGLVVLIGGAAWGGSIINRTSPELLEFTLQN